jgi:hypothetical protein
MPQLVSSDCSVPGHRFDEIIVTPNKAFIIYSAMTVTVRMILASFHQDSNAQGSVICIVGKIFVAPVAGLIQINIPASAWISPHGFIAYHGFNMNQIVG